MGPTSSSSAEKVTPGSREEILLKLRERIVAYAASRLQRDAAEDLAQEVLILLHEKYGHLEKLEDLLPLSMQIVGKPFDEATVLQVGDAFQQLTDWHLRVAPMVAEVEAGPVLVA